MSWSSPSPPFLLFLRLPIGSNLSWAAAPILPATLALFSLLHNTLTCKHSVPYVLHFSSLAPSTFLVHLFGSFRHPPPFSLLSRRLVPHLVLLPLSVPPSTWPTASLPIKFCPSLKQWEHVLTSQSAVIVPSYRGRLHVPVRKLNQQKIQHHTTTTNDEQLNGPARTMAMRTSSHAPPLQSRSPFVSRFFALTLLKQPSTKTYPSCCC